jgi:hypothetical protein
MVAIEDGLLARRTRAGVLALALAVALAATGIRPAAAQSVLHVTGQADGPGACDAQGSCSTLRAAVTQANATPDTTIDVPAGTFTLQSTLDLTGSMTIIGAGAGSTFVDGGRAVRVLSVGSKAAVTISALTVQNGKVGDDEFGAGIRNKGNLTLNDASVTGNDALGSEVRGVGFGGGIANAGTLHVNRGSVSDNRAGSGAGILTFPASDAPFGVVVIDGTKIEGNGAPLGGGIADFGPLQLRNSTLDGQNSAAFGGALLVETLQLIRPAEVFRGDADVSTTTIADNSAGLNGAGVFVADGAVVRLATSTLSGNVAGRLGDGGDGGGIYNNLGTLTVTNVSLNVNDAHDGQLNGAFVMGHGGGIAQFTIDGDVRGGPADHVSISKFVRTMARDAGFEATFGFHRDSTTIVNFTTIAGNVTDSGTTAGQSITDTAGGLFASPATPNHTSTFTVHNSIVAGNTGQNCVSEALPTSSGYNLEDTSTCGFDKTGDQANANPNLGKLAGNGGPTATMALPAGSPAVDAADPACDVSADQRGVKRPQGPRCDIGAFELETSTSMPSAVPAAPVTGLDAARGGAALPLLVVLLALVAPSAAGLGVVLGRRGSA